MAWWDDLSYSEIGDYAWYWDNSLYTTHTVGQKEPNAWGLYDMHGNVWEWYLDWYGSYEDTQQTDPLGPPTGSDRVGRGGGWKGRPAELPVCPSWLQHAQFRGKLPGLPPREGAIVIVVIGSHN